MPGQKIEKPKKQSVRLRAVLYKLWEQSEQKVEAEEYYEARMEELINVLKSKLN